MRHNTAAVFPEGGIPTSQRRVNRRESADNVYKMSLGAVPLDERGVRSVIDRKMADFAHVVTLTVRHVEYEEYLRIAARHPDIQFGLETGVLSDLAAELRDPVLADQDVLYTCPLLALQVLRGEPAEIHRPFVEGAFIRKLFLYFVPGRDRSLWEAAGEVRTIMQRHFSLQLVVTEALLGAA